jgi:hypothetical protein
MIAAIWVGSTQGLLEYQGRTWSLIVFRGTVIIDVWQPVERTGLYSFFSRTVKFSYSQGITEESDRGWHLDTVLAAFRKDVPFAERFGLVRPRRMASTGPFLPGNAWVLPFWALLVAGAILSAWLWWRDRRPPPGHCQSCGYDLTGNASGVCPECGEES